MFGQCLIHQGLVANAPPPRFLAELIEHIWVDANRDQLTGPLAERGSANATHRPQLLG
jgi:hypothetical protein